MVGGYGGLRLPFGYVRATHCERCGELERAYYMNYRHDIDMDLCRACDEEVPFEGRTCNQCGAREQSWQDERDELCPFSAHPDRSCDGVLRRIEE